jgi:hypothetical protein
MSSGRVNKELIFSGCWLVCYAWRSWRYYGRFDPGSSYVRTRAFLAILYSSYATVHRIGWPFAGDQPGNIAHLVHTLDVAFEFVEVRTGANGLKPIYQTGKTPKGTLEAFREELNDVLDNLNSEIGIRKKKNAQKQQEILARAWVPGGSTYASFQVLVKQFDL